MCSNKSDNDRLNGMFANVVKAYCERKGYDFRLFGKGCHIGDFIEIWVTVRDLPDEFVMGEEEPYRDLLEIVRAFFHKNGTMDDQIRYFDDDPYCMHEPSGKTTYMVFTFNAFRKKPNKRLLYGLFGRDDLYGKGCAGLLSPLLSGNKD